MLAFMLFYEIVWGDATWFFVNDLPIITEKLIADGTIYCVNVWQHAQQGNDH